ncbi:MAG: VWA domain-containing protein [Pseudomonadota bacterium]
MSAERTLTEFVRALRSADVPVSTAEAIAAVEAVRLMGYQDKDVLKDSLRPVLAKSVDEASDFDRLFDLFFARRAPETSGGGEGAQADGESEGEAPQDMVELAQSGDEAAIAMAIEQAGRDANVQDIRFSTQTAYYAQQMMKAMGVEKLESRLLDRLQAHTEEADAEAEALMGARRDMMRRAREHANAQFEVFGRGETDRFREDFLSEKRISDFDRSDHERMKALVAKMAKRLAVKHSRRRRKKNRGQLDVRRTLRRNAGRDSVPFDVHWKQKKRDRPKFIAICDVSGSVARYVRFLLLLLHSLNDVVPHFRAFAFSARLTDVGDWLDTDGFERAMERIVRDVGMGSTDYGQALSDLKVDHWNAIDRRTTLFILGDGRSNYADPRLDLFKEAAARAKRTIWLNPEGPSGWGTGDSVIPRYKPFCNTMEHVATLKDLERAVDTALAAYT